MLCHIILQKDKGFFCWLLHILYESFLSGGLNFVFSVQEKNMFG